MIAAKGRVSGFADFRPAARSMKSTQMRGFASKKGAQMPLRTDSARERQFSRWVRISFYKSAIRIGRCTGSFGSILWRTFPASITPRPSGTRAIRDRGVDLGHIEGVVVSLAVSPLPRHIQAIHPLSQEKSYSKICAPTRIVGVSAFPSAHAEPPNRRT